MKIAVIGGGAAGLMAALTAGGKGLHIDLYEQNSEVGKKILASGNGRCNISNTNLSAEHYHGEDPSFVTPALKRFDYKAFERFCEDMALILDVKSDGRVYPLSNEAKSVQAAMRREALRAGVKIFTEKRVVGIGKDTNGFVVGFEDETKHYDTVLLATGSAAAPQLGGSLDGLRFAKELGHEVVEPYPTLVGLHLAGRLQERVAGVKVDAGLTLYVDGRVAKRTRGDLLFTRYGISGFSVLDISTEASLSLSKGKSVTVGLHLLPGYDRQGVLALIERLAKRSYRLKPQELLQAFLNSKVAKELLKFLNIEPTVSVAELDRKLLRKIAATVTDWRFSVIQTHGFKHAECAGGGVLTKDVDPKTMESKKVPGLYFAGEILDIVGDRGGYNLHFAWASGHMAGLSMSRH